jgi:wyosine [tRNA(Phe)-imidazoG37] synthetase (radical SAM superfamily)
MEKNAEKMIRISLKTPTDKEFREIERPGPFVLEDLVKEIQKIYRRHYFKDEILI